MHMNSYLFRFCLPPQGRRANPVSVSVSVGLFLLPKLVVCAGKQADGLGREGLLHDAEPPRTAVSAASQHSQAMRPPTSQRRVSDHNAKLVWHEILSVGLDHLMGLEAERALIKAVCVGTWVVGTGAVCQLYTYFQGARCRKLATKLCCFFIYFFAYCDRIYSVLFEQFAFSLSASLSCFPLRTCLGCCWAATSLF